MPRSFTRKRYPTRATSVEPLRLDSALAPGLAEYADTLKAYDPITLELAALREFNQNHDEKGRFSAGDGASGEAQAWQSDPSREGIIASVRFAQSAFSAPFPQGLEATAINDYTNRYAQHVNEVLRQGGVLDRHSQLVVNGLDSLIAKSSPTQSVTVFRGFQTDDALHGLGPGDSFVDHGFSSTSLRQDVATAYESGNRGQWATSGSGYENSAALNRDVTPSIAEIHVPAGTPAYAEDAHGNSGTSNLGQVILPRDSSFTVRSSDLVDGIRHVVLDYSPPGS